MLRISFKKTIGILLAISTAITSGGCKILIEQDETVKNESLQVTEASLPENYYVWHNDYTDDYATGQQSGYVEHNVYTPVYINYHSFEGKTKYRPTPEGKPKRIIWLTEDEVDLIPTYYKGDEIILKASEYRPEEIILERFFDEGWTFGIYGMAPDATGRYMMTTKIDDDDDDYYFFPLSEAFELAKTLPDTTITIDKIGGNELRSGNIAASGFVSNLAKNNIYDLEVYVGTKSHNIQLKADSKILVSKECFSVTDYTLENSYIALIRLPAYLRPGYYYIDGIGLFRYLNSPYGTAVSETINYNEPTFTYDERGRLTEDRREHIRKVYNRPLPRLGKDRTPCT